MPWIVLDRDGVINHDSDDYIKSPDEWQAIDGSIEAIAQLSKAGYHVVVATNQSGISRGFFDLATLDKMHNKLRDLVAAEGGKIEGIFYCPHLPSDNCECRKPKTGLLDAIESEFEISLAGCPFVGDSLKDLQLARAKDCQAILVTTGKGKITQEHINEDPEYSDIPIFDNLASYTTHLLSKR